MRIRTHVQMTTPCVDFITAGKQCCCYNATAAAAKVVGPHVVACCVLFAALSDCCNQRQLTMHHNPISDSCCQKIFRPNEMVEVGPRINAAGDVLSIGGHRPIAGPHPVAGTTGCVPALEILLPCLAPMSKAAVNQLAQAVIRSTAS